MKKKTVMRIVTPLLLVFLGMNGVANTTLHSGIVYGTSAEQGAHDGAFEVYMVSASDESLIYAIRNNYFSTGKIMEMLNRGRCLGYYETLKAEGWIPQDFVPTSMQSSSSGSSNSSTSSQTSTSTPTTTEPEKTYTDEEIATAWKETSRTEPTCTNVGTIKYKNTITGKTKSEEIPVIEHTYEISEQVPVTCTEDGEITYTCKMLINGIITL